MGSRVSSVLSQNTLIKRDDRITQSYYLDNVMDNVFRKQESLRRSIFQAGYDYAKNCFESVLDDMDIPHLEDGRVNPHWLDINGAASEIMGWGDTIPLDKSLFPTFNDGDSIWCRGRARGTTCSAQMGTGRGGQMGTARSAQ